MKSLFALVEGYLPDQWKGFGGKYIDKVYSGMTPEKVIPSYYKVAEESLQKRLVPKDKYEAGYRLLVVDLEKLRNYRHSDKWDEILPNGSTTRIDGYRYSISKVKTKEIGEAEYSFSVTLSWGNHIASREREANVIPSDFKPIAKAPPSLVELTDTEALLKKAFQRISSLYTSTIWSGRYTDTQNTRYIKNRIKLSDVYKKMFVYGDRSVLPQLEALAMELLFPPKGEGVLSKEVEQLFMDWYMEK